MLILGKEIEGYLDNRLATPFLNWELSANTFEQPDRYKNIININRYFERDTPEVIIDSNTLMPKVFERLPQWSKKYKHKKA